MGRNGRAHRVYPFAIFLGDTPIVSRRAVNVVSLDVSGNNCAAMTGNLGDLREEREKGVSGAFLADRSAPRAQQRETLRKVHE